MADISTTGVSHLKSDDDFYNIVYHDAEKKIYVYSCIACTDRLGFPQQMASTLVVLELYKRPRPEARERKSIEQSDEKGVQECLEAMQHPSNRKKITSILCQINGNC